MLTIGHYKAAQAVKSYFKEHLEKGDYYSEQGKVLGKWVGKASLELGIESLDAVKEADFQALVDGLHPKTQKKLGVRARKDRIVSFDMVFSAPKSVSIMALTLRDERLLLAHENAVALAFEQMEKKASTRVRKGLSLNSRKSRVTGNLVAARFTHVSSRELDPQLHTHHLVFNLTYDPVEKRTKALDAYQIFMGTKFLSEVYRNALAKEVRALGYDIEEGRHTWRIQGIPLEVEAVFSKRALEIERKAKRLEAETGIKLDTRGRALVSIKSRSAKNKEIGDEDLLKYQRAQLTAEQLTTLEAIKAAAIGRATGIGVETSPIPTGTEKNLEALARGAGGVESGKVLDREAGITPLPELVAREVIQYALDHVFERKSVVNRDDLLKEALKRSAGRVTFEEIEKELHGPRFIHRGADVMTREERQREVHLLELARSGKRKFRALGETNQLSEKLTPEQKKAAKRVLESFDQFFFLSGKAGTGKTFTLTEIVRHAAVPVIMTAPTSGAADKLRSDGFSEALTAQKLLMSPFEQKKAKGALIIVDEAGLLSTRQMESLLKFSKENDSRLLLVGDTAQHNSVEGGDGLRLLETYSVMDRAEISMITRQKSIEYREAIQALSQGQIEKGFSKLDKLGAVQEVSREERPKLVAVEYAEKVKSGVDTLIVTPTWTEHDRVTVAVREELKKQDLLGQQEATLSVFKSVNFTRTEKRYAPNFQEGLYVSFHSDQDGFKQGEMWKIQGSSENHVKLENERGESRLFEPKNFIRSFDVVQREEKGFAVGDKILMKANYATSPTNRIPNGAIRTIEAIEQDGTIRLNGEKYLDRSFRHFTHGYAITSQASQGKDAEHVIISADSKSKLALSKNQFYVSASRGKRSISLYTDEKSLFKEAVEKSSARELVLERIVQRGILKEKLRALKTSYDRSVELSRDHIERAFRKYRDQSKEQRNKEKIYPDPKKEHSLDRRYSERERYSRGRSQRAFDRDLER